MDEKYNKQYYSSISLFNIKNKLKHYILNDYYNDLLVHLVNEKFINENDVKKINEDFYIFVNNN